MFLLFLFHLSSGCVPLFLSSSFLLVEGEDGEEENRGRGAVSTECDCIFGNDCVVVILCTLSLFVG